MNFAVPSAAYDRFMGRYSSQLAPLFAEFASIAPGMRTLDIGCGPGALTGELVRRAGPANVAAIEPSPTFVEECRKRFPEADIRSGGAETLPWPDRSFDAALAQLVLAFVSDADRVAAEMRRVVREHGTVAACMWHEGASLQMSDLFWEAASTVDPSVRQRESKMPYRKHGEIAALFSRAGLRDVHESMLEVRASYRDFDDLWEPMWSAPGPIGAYLATLEGDRRTAIRDAFRKHIGRAGSFELSAKACAVRARV